MGKENFDQILDVPTNLTISRGIQGYQAVVEHITYLKRKGATPT